MSLKDQLGGHVGGSAHSLLDEDGQGNLHVNATPPPLPSEEELTNTYVAPGSDAILPLGIVYQALWKKTSDGMARHAREQVRSLAMTGLPVQLLSFGQQVILNEELAPEVRDISYLEGISFKHTAICIKQLTVFKPHLLREVLCPAGIRGSATEAQVKRMLNSTILYTSWERDRVHPDYVALLQDIGQVWVPCRANAIAFTASGVPGDKVKVVPYPYRPETYPTPPRSGPIAVLPEPKTEKSYYNIGKWEPRKNQHGLIGAFLLAHTPKDRASLLIKTSGFGVGWSGYPSCEESVQHWLKDDRVQARGWDQQSFDRLVRIIEQNISESDIQQLHLRNNIYVSASHGEAWDLPAFDAKMYGNALVHVGFGGSQDYAESSDFQVKDGGCWELVHPDYLWEPDARWAKVDTEKLAQAMSLSKPNSVRAVPASYCQKFSSHAVANIMEKCIQDLAEELGCWNALKASGGYG